MSVGALIMGIVVLLVIVLLVVVSACGEHVEPPEEFTSPIYSNTPIDNSHLRYHPEVETEEERKKKKRQASQQEEQRLTVDDDGDITFPILANIVADHDFKTYIPAEQPLYVTPEILSNSFTPSVSVPLQAEYQDPVADRGYEVASHSDSSPSYNSSPSYDSSYDSSGGSFDSGGDCGGCDCGGD